MGRWEDRSEYATRSNDLNGWMDNLVNVGKFSCRDDVIEGLAKDYKKRFLKDASPAEKFVLNTVATGLRLSLPESEVVRLVTDATGLGFMPKSWARRKARKAVNKTLKGLGICSNIHLFGMAETMNKWGKDEMSKQTPGEAILSVLGNMAGAVAKQVFRPRRRSYNFGPYNVSAHVRRTKSGRTVYVKAHRRKRK